MAVDADPDARMSPRELSGCLHLALTADKFQCALNKPIRADAHLVVELPLRAVIHKPIR